MNKSLMLFILIILTISGCKTENKMADAPKSFSGIYPHLAMYDNGGECDTGAVVPWSDRLRVVTYAPHSPKGSDNKLYEITPSLEQITFGESIGGTPANRMIHKESNQLFIGPYAIDSARNVRVISWKDMPGRLTGNARHLTDPANKIYCGTMEEGFYEVDVKDLHVTELYKDGNLTQKKGDMAQAAELLERKLPDDMGEDSFSFLSSILGKSTNQPVRKSLVTDSMMGLFAIQEGQWKLIFGKGGGGFYLEGKSQLDSTSTNDPPGQLYNLDIDLGETNNLYAEKPEIVAHLTLLLEKIRSDEHSRPYEKLISGY